MRKIGIAKRIKRARLEAGLTQKKLAQLVSVHPSTIGLWERGENRPRPYHLRIIAEMTNKPISYFLEDDFIVPSSSATNQTPVFIFDPNNPPPLLKRLEGRLLEIEERIETVLKQIERILKERREEKWLTK